MFSHIVVLWADPAQPDAADKLVESAKRLLTNIPGVTMFHAGKMVGSPRPVVEQTEPHAMEAGEKSRNKSRTDNGEPVKPLAALASATVAPTI